MFTLINSFNWKTRGGASVKNQSRYCFEVNIDRWIGSRCAPFFSHKLQDSRFTLQPNVEYRKRTLCETLDHLRDALCKKCLKPLSFLAFLFILSSNIQAQKYGYQFLNQEEVETIVATQLDASLQTDEFRKMLQTHDPEQGYLTLDITVYKKGKVMSIYQVESNLESVPLRNDIKNWVKYYKFDLNKKIRRNASHKVRHTLNIK